MSLLKPQIQLIPGSILTSLDLLALATSKPLLALELLHSFSAIMIRQE